MAQSYQVTCINKIDRASAHESIRRIGGPGWSMSQQEAIRQISAGESMFWGARAGVPSGWLVVARSAAGNLYVKTEADGEMPNNLLSLPECPAS